MTKRRGKLQKKQPEGIRQCRSLRAAFVLLVKKLCLVRRANGTDTLAGAAADAGIRVNNKFAITGRNGGNGALGLACAAVDALIIDFVCQRKHLQKIFKLIVPQFRNFATGFLKKYGQKAWGSNKKPRFGFVRKRRGRGGVCKKRAACVQACRWGGVCKMPCTGGPQGAATPGPSARARRHPSLRGRHG